MTANMCISVVWVVKKKSRPTDPFFFQTCYSKHSFFFFGLIGQFISELHTLAWLQNKPLWSCARHSLLFLRSLWNLQITRAGIKSQSNMKCEIGWIIVELLAPWLSGMLGLRLAKPLVKMSLSWESLSSEICNQTRFKLAWPGAVARSEACLLGIQAAPSSIYTSGTFFRGDGHENISTAIFPLPLIQEEQLSVTGKRMCTKYW